MTFLEKLNWVSILSIVVAIETQIGNGSMSLANMFPDAWIPYIKAWSANLGSIGAAIMAVYAYGSKRVPGDSFAVRAISSDGSAAPVKGDHVVIASNSFQRGDGSGTVAKVVGAILIAFMLASFTYDHARAASLDPLNALKNFAVSDIQAALDDATANSDTAAVACWAALLPVVQSQQALTLKKMGVFLALQKARDAVRSVDMLRAGLGPIGDLKNKCAPIIVDTNTFLLRLGVVGAGAVLPF